MRLSEAILLGLPEIRFTQSTWLSREPDGTCKGCLVGAALYANGDRNQRCDAIKTMEEFWPWTAELKNYSNLVCPFCLYRTGFFANHFGTVLTHLANHYRFGGTTGAQIADYIRSIEPAEEEAPVQGETVQGEPVTAEQGRGVLVAKP